MKLREATKVVIITEALIEEQIISLLAELGVHAYTIFREIAGEGTRGIRSGDCLGKMCSNVCIEVVIDEEARAQAVIEAVYNKFLAKHYAGIAYLENVRAFHH